MKKLKESDILQNLKNEFTNQMAVSGNLSKGGEAMTSLLNFTNELKEYEKMIRKSNKKSGLNKLVGNTKMDKPTGKLYSVGKSENKESMGAANAGGYSQPLFTTTKKEVEEKWSKKYKDSINCNNPKGFSQRAHCQGKKKNVSEEELTGGKSDKLTLKDIAKKHDKKGYYHVDNMVEVLKKQLNMGIRVEMEHTDNKEKAKEIAMDHLYEDPKYYTKLSKIETKESKLNGKFISENRKKSIDDMTDDEIYSLRDSEFLKLKDVIDSVKTPEQYEVLLNYWKFFQRKFDGYIPKRLKQEIEKDIKSQRRLHEDSSLDDLLKKYKSMKDQTPKTKKALESGERKSVEDLVKKYQKIKDEESKIKKKNKDKKEKEEVKKTETKEATSSSSSGSYVTTSAWAKSTKKKDWRGKSKTQIPGGKFVQVKKKCKTFPYCNQGDINALKIFENTKLKKVIKDVSESYGVSEQMIKNIIAHELFNK